MDEYHAGFVFTRPSGHHVEKRLEAQKKMEV